MLGIGGRFVGAKGMVAMPDISNLSPDQALSSLQSAGLVRGTLSSSETSNASLNNKTFNQSIAPGTLVDYETVINYSFYLYIPPPAPPEQPPAPTPVLCGSQYWVEASRVWDCSLGNGVSRTQINEELRQNYCISGVPTGQYIVYSTNTYYFSDAAQRDGVCGYTVPAPTPCNPSFDEISRWYGACSGGSQILAIRYRNSCTGEETVISQTISCCTPVISVVSTWRGSCISCYRQTATRYRNSCTGEETVVNGSEYCCSASGGGGGAGGQNAV